MERPMVATILGVIDLLFGLLGLCTGLFSVGMTVMMVAFSSELGGIPDNSPFAQVAKMQGGAVTPLTLATAGVNLLVSIVLLFAGIGLLMTRDWGRKLAITISFVTLAYFVVFDVIVNIVNSGQTAAMMEQQLQTEISPSFILVMLVTSILMSAVFHVFYPLMQIFFLTRSNVKQAFGAIR